MPHHQNLELTKPWPRRWPRLRSWCLCNSLDTQSNKTNLVLSVEKFNIGNETAPSIRETRTRAVATNMNRMQAKDWFKRVGSWLHQSLVSQRQSRMPMEGLSIDAASANVGRRCMELLDIWEEEEEATATPRLTWECHFYWILRCGMLKYLSILVARPFSMSLLSSWLLSSW